MFISITAKISLLIHKINIVIIHRKPAQFFQFHKKTTVLSFTATKQSNLAALFKYFKSYAFDNYQIHFSHIRGTCIVFAFFVHSYRGKADQAI